MFERIWGCDSDARRTFSALVDWALAGMCAAWIAALVLVTADAHGGIALVLANSVAADWVQALVGCVGVLGTIVAIYWSVRAGYLHQDRQREVAHAERLAAAYLLARLAGAAVIHADRWLRDAAEDPDRRRADRQEMKRYPAAWEAWTADRLGGYIDNLARLDISTLASADFISDLLTVRTRANWFRMNVGPLVGTKSAISVAHRQRLQLAARDVLFSLSKMRARADKALTSCSLPAVAVEAFPRSSCPFSEPDAIQKWERRTASA